MILSVVNGFLECRHLFVDLTKPLLCYAMSPRKHFVLTYHYEQMFLNIFICSTGCTSEEKVNLSYLSATISMAYIIISSCHGNGLAIGGVYLRYTRDYLIGSRIIIGFMDNRRVHGYMHKRLIGCPITMDNGV